MISFKITRLKLKGVQSQEDLNKIVETFHNFTQTEIDELNFWVEVKKRELSILNLKNENFFKEHRVNGALVRQDEIKKCESLDRLIMKRDPLGKLTGEAHEDKNGIALYNERTGNWVGYISAKANEFFDKPGGLAAWLAPKLDNGEEWDCYIKYKVGEDKGSVGLRIWIIKLKGEWAEWDGENAVIDQPVYSPIPEDTKSYDSKLTDILLAFDWVLTEEEDRKMFKSIRNFRYKYGTYSPSHLEWIEAVHESLSFLDSL